MPIREFWCMTKLDAGSSLAAAENFRKLQTASNIRQGVKKKHVIAALTTTRPSPGSPKETGLARIASSLGKLILQ